MPNPAMRPDRPEYFVQTGSMFENPYGVPHEEIVSMILELPVEVAAQVIFGKYVESSGLVFSSELIEMMVDPELPRVTGDYYYDEDVVRQCRAIGKERGRDWLKSRYHGGIDFARQTDFTVLSVIDTTQRPARLVYYKRLNRVPWESIYREVGRMLDIFGPSAIGDSTGMGGDVIFDALESRLYCCKHDRTFLVQDGVCRGARDAVRADCTARDHISLGSVDPFNFSTSSKKELLEHFRNVLAVGYLQNSGLPFGWLRTPRIVQLVEECSFYVWADKGMETDSLMSVALACWQGLEDAPAPVLVGSVHGA